MKTNIDEGRIVKALAGFYYIDDGHEVHQCRARGKFRKQDIKPVVGDFVEFQKGNHDDGYLLKILERKNVLRRPPIANIDQALLVFSRKEPDFSTVLLDKFLLLIEHYHIKPIIVISKMDIEGDDSIYQYIQEYRNAGYTDEYATACKFRGCLHDSEPHCAVKEAVDEGKISKERYEHYLTMLKELKEKKEKRYG